MAERLELELECMVESKLCFVVFVVSDLPTCLGIIDTSSFDFHHGFVGDVFSSSRFQRA